MLKLLLLPLLFIPLFYGVDILSHPERENHDLTMESDETASTYTVTATIYHPDPKQCNAEFNITADGSKIDTLNPSKHRWVAISRDMIKRYGGEFDFGDTIRVEGTGSHLDGFHIVKDLMNKRYRHRIDFLVSKDDIYGRWEKIKIQKHN